MKSENSIINDLENLSRKILDLSAAQIDQLNIDLANYKPDNPGAYTVYFAMQLMLESIKDIDFEDTNYHFDNNHY